MTNKEAATMLKSIRGLFSVSYSPESIVALSKAIELFEQMPDEHGDLIDRDDVKEEILKRIPSWCATSGTGGYRFCSRRKMLYSISRAKVIIAAERKDDEADSDVQR